MKWYEKARPMIEDIQFNDRVGCYVGILEHFKEGVFKQKNE